MFVIHAKISTISISLFFPKTAMRILNYAIKYKEQLRYGDQDDKNIDYSDGEYYNSKWTDRKRQ